MMIDIMVSGRHTLDLEGLNLSNSGLRKLTIQMQDSRLLTHGEYIVEQNYQF